MMRRTIWKLVTAAMALGDDWLDDALSADEHRAVHQAIITHGLTPGRRAYRDDDSWTKAQHNWNFVCNGGLVLGALAVAEDEPKLAGHIISNACQSMQHALERFGPDGGWEEGPSYWNYATRYAVYAMAALQSATGDDAGLSNARGFNRTGMFRIHVQGPTRKLFNFGDCAEHTASSPQTGRWVDLEETFR